MNEIKVDIQTKPHPYGFGYNWSLVLEKDGKTIDKKMLGQDAKVSQRVLGIDDPMEHYAEKYRADNPDHSGAVSFEDVSQWIAADIISVMTGAEYNSAAKGFVGGMKLTDENLMELAEKPSWSMAVE